jgi:hypothetical protein
MLVREGARSLLIGLLRATSIGGTEENQGLQRSEAERTGRGMMMWKSLSGSTSPPVYRRVLVSSAGSQCKAEPLSFC